MLRPSSSFGFWLSFSFKDWDEITGSHAISASLERNFTNSDNFGNVPFPVLNWWTTRLQRSIAYTLETSLRLSWSSLSSLRLPILFVAFSHCTGPGKTENLLRRDPSLAGIFDQALFSGDRLQLLHSGHPTISQASPRPFGRRLLIREAGSHKLLLNHFQPRTFQGNVASLGLDGSTFN